MTPSGHRRCQAPCRAPGTGRVSSSRRAFFVDKLFTIARNLSTKKHLRDFPTILPLVHLDCGRSLAQVWLKLRISLHPPWGALTVAGACFSFWVGRFGAALSKSLNFEGLRGPPWTVAGIQMRCKAVAAPRC